MSLKIEDIKADIRIGKCKAIYLSEKFLWWTHLESDLVDATLQGERYLIKNDLLNYTHMQIASKYKDPLGGKIITNKEPGLFISQTLMNPKHYGKYKIQAFMKAHHQNCGNYFSNKWQGYNDLIDRLKNGKV